MSKRWPRRLLYLFLVVIWLAIMLFPFLAAVLAIQGQIEVGGNGRSHVRLFLVQQPEAEGVGITWTRPLRAQSDCRQTSLVYIMWRGEGENVSFCECETPEGDPVIPATCP